MRRRTLTAGVLAAVLVTAVPAVQRAEAQESKRGQGGDTSFTLITGDRVTVGADGQPVIERGPGRAGMTFVSSREGGHRFVVPADALPLLRDGRLDRRLFDLTTLGEFGYDDRAAALPLLVAYPEGKMPEALGAARRLPAIGAAAVSAEKAGRTALWTTLAGMTHVWLDGKRKVSLDRSVPRIGAPAAWQAGFDGTGVTVGVLDSGIDATHPDFAGHIAVAEDFTGTGIADTVGHGTHVASTIAGNGGTYRGVAPGAKLAVGKVCADEECQDSAIIAGMQWAAPRAKVVNLSLGADDTPGLDPLETAVQGLSAQYGTLFVIAAGNEGKPRTVSSPASADDALAVAAVDADDNRAYFSSQGPRIGDNHIKPEISAPGVDITAAAPGGGYATMSGTSMATPHVAGSAAILAQQHPDWSGTQLKAALMGSAVTKPGELYQQGAGRVDIGRAVAQPVAADVADIDFPVQRWPHGDDTPVTRTVGYLNSGGTPVTLALSTGTSPNVTVSPATLVVPAGGRAGVTLTVDTRVEAPDGLETGALNATGPGDLRISTPYALNREIESYDVTVPTTGRDGKPATVAETVAANLSTGEFTTPDAGVMRLAKGRYALYSTIHDGDVTTLLAQPVLDVHGPVTEALDARTAKPITISVPEKDAAPVAINVSANWDDGIRYPGVQLSAGTFAQVYLGRIGPRTEAPEFSATLGIGLARPGRDRTFRNSPYSYDLAYVLTGDMFTGLTKKPGPRTLATVHATYRKQTSTATGTRFHRAAVPGGPGPIGASTAFDLPFHATEYYNTDGGLVWTTTFLDGDNSTVSDDTYQAGKAYTRTWNNAPFGPGTAPGWATRDGDVIAVQPPLFTDASGRPASRDDLPVHFRLLRDGVVVGESNELPFAEFEVPAGRAAYRLEATVTRGAPDTLSSSVAAVWTFTSARTDEVVDLPLVTPSVAPRLDDTNTARAGSTLAVPVEAATRVSVSFDDGRTWIAVPVARGIATITHPRRAGFVSLRLTADGATVTLLRAYRMA
ncbi:S8 family peptidase [Winogradskya consettensis]|uniref:S8 family peptidase n=1 Tax=Winogradskya consettensis TaxID=113560 RepID=UPI001BB41B0B|nr:S8 family serine peptidase [Actinoplanes consettensis]